MPVEGRGLSSRQTQDVVRDREIGQPSNSEECSEAADSVTRESEGRSRLSLLCPVRQAQPRRHSGARLCPVLLQQGRAGSRRSGLCGHRSVWGRAPSAASEHSSELLGCPISRSLTTSYVCLELRPLPSTGITRSQRYCEPLRHPSAPGLSLAGIRLIIPDHALGLPVLRTLSLCTCRRHYPGAADRRTRRSNLPIHISLPRNHYRVGLHIVLFEIP